MSACIAAPGRRIGIGGAATTGINWLLRSEGAAALLGATVVFGRIGQPWWLFAVLFLLPDLSMAGYLTGPRLGATVYNAGHTYVAPLLLGLAGAMWTSAPVLAVAAVWVAHIGFDRMLGYGLKHASGFGDTHLGRIGRPPG
jgi:hypothetical protein